MPRSRRTARCEFKKLFYDTANSFYAPTIAALTSYVPETQIVFGTDYPYLTTGANLDGLRKLVTPAQMAAIGRDNAVRLLPRLQGDPVKTARPFARFFLGVPRRRPDIL